MGTILRPWSMSGNAGASSFVRTVVGLAERGFVIDVAFPDRAEDHGDPFGSATDEARPRIHDVPLSHASEHMRRRRQAHGSASSHGPTTAAPQSLPRSSRSYVPGGPATLAEHVKIALEARSFSAALSSWLDAQERTPDTIAYAYEVHAVRSFRRHARRATIPLVSRFQGTIVPPCPTRTQRLLLHDHLAALRAPAALTIMTDDGTQGDVVLDRLGVDPRSVRFWRNGVELDTSAMLPSGAVRRAGVPVALTASRLIRWKRVDRVLDAVEAANRRGTELDLWVAGDGPERVDLEQQARRLGFADQIHFLGSVPNDAMAALHGEADMYVSCFDLSNVGNPTLEALASGTPVITFRQPGMSGVVVDGENGLLADDGDVDGISRRIAQLAGDDALRGRLAGVASDWAAANLWTWRERLDAEASEIERLIHGARRA